MRPSTRIVKIRRQPLRQANLAPDAVLRAVTQVAVERLRRHRRVVAVAAAVCWGQFFYTQVDWGGVGRPGERVRVG
ncbi:MAG TPA: hypothetical protein VK689_01605, partial [Armatimonadota bacterium]|nr:hypothetical protein [Armatimonadota bacterium]